MANSATYDVRVWQGDAEGGEFVHYDVPAQESQTVLDAVTWIQQNAAPALTYRFACRVGMCGSCAMVVNGEPRWTCRTHIKKVAAVDNVVTIEPLRNQPIIKDLAVDMSEFFAKWIKAEGVFHPTKTRDDPIERISPDSKERRLADAGIECINCSVCYSACDVVQALPDYLGPAALNRAWTLVNDVRDGEQHARLRAVAADAGCHNCHSHQSCMTYCPVGLNPTASIAGLKRKTLMATLIGKL